MTNAERAKYIVDTIRGDVGYAGKNPVEFVEAQLNQAIEQNAFVFEYSINGRSVKYAAPTVDGLLELRQKLKAESSRSFLITGVESTFSTANTLQHTNGMPLLSEELARFNAALAESKKASFMTELIGDGGVECDGKPFLSAEESKNAKPEKKPWEFLGAP